MNMTRREALQRLSAGTLLALGLWPGALRAKENPVSGSFRFLVANDLHYMTPECGEWLTGVMKQMKSHDAEFLIAAGDLTEYGKREHLQAVRKIFKGLGIPFYVQIGNHDYLTQTTDRRGYEKTFPKSINYYFMHRGWQFVGLDTSEGRLWEKTQIQSDTFAWVNENLRKLDKKAPLAIFTHFPLGPGVTYRPGNADVLLEMFREHNLQAVLSGHWHGFTEKHLGKICFTTNACCALKRGNHDRTKKKGYFLCTARDGDFTRIFVECQMPRESQSSS